MKRNDFEGKVLKILTDVDAQRLKPEEAFKIIDDLYVLQARIMQDEKEYEQEEVEV
ncbi:MAG: hypothetical protein JW874_13000 [Spirochaetales bacterium]|nr:hypothetical protein [Spirochaetales bacterium]